MNWSSEGVGGGGREGEREKEGNKSLVWSPGTSEVGYQALGIVLTSLVPFKRVYVSKAAG